MAADEARAAGNENVFPSMKNYRHADNAGTPGSVNLRRAPRRGGFPLWRAAAAAINQAIKSNEPIAALPGGR
jgi:hypothetical protein